MEQITCEYDCKSAQDTSAEECQFDKTMEINTLVLLKSRFGRT